MAFDIGSLTVNWYEEGDAVWNYTTADALSATDGGGYFDAGAKALRRGDVIRVTASDGKKVYLVTDSQPASGSVSVSPRAVVSSFVN